MAGAADLVALAGDQRRHDGADRLGVLDDQHQRAGQASTSPAPAAVGRVQSGW
jgi:hypothetical protein